MASTNSSANMNTTTSANSKFLRLVVAFCDFLVWTQKELHIEHLTLDETLVMSALPTAKTVFNICILPGLLGKWYTC